MATTYSSATSALDEIRIRIQANRSKLLQAQALAASAESDLIAMQTAYGQIVTDIDTASANAPNDVAYTNLKADKDKLVAEFNTLKTGATNMKTATTGVTF